MAEKTFGERAASLFFKLIVVAVGLAIVVFGANNWSQNDQATPLDVGLILFGLTWAAGVSGATKTDWWHDESFGALRFFAGLCICAGAVYMGILADPQYGFWWACLTPWGAGITTFEFINADR